MLAGMMMDRPLSIPAILAYAAEVRPHGAVVSAAVPAAGAALRKGPDDVLFRVALPLAATGKVSKLERRKLLAGSVLPTAA
jgi:non-ribosomal peptide synthetase component E (peptide arylation enzyme)